MVIDELVGHKILFALKEADGVFLTCSDGTRISIFNPISDGESFVEAYIGEKITGVNYNDGTKEFVIRFEKCRSLSIDLRDSAFSGPEGLVIARGSEILVFD